MRGGGPKSIKYSVEREGGAGAFVLTDQGRAVLAALLR
jgi:hypothetical protein